MAEKKQKNKPVEFIAYNMITKKKNRVILNPVISKTANGAYIAEGHDDDGTPLKCLVTKEEQAHYNSVRKKNCYENDKRN